MKKGQQPHEQCSLCDGSIPETLLADKRNQWHNRGAKRAYVIVFADGHACYFIFPGAYGMADRFVPPSPGFLWW
jgi:hypothetical protein